MFCIGYYIGPAVYAELKVNVTWPMLY